MCRPVCPQKLPLKNLKWESFVGLLAQAHSTLGHFDQILKRMPHPQKLLKEHAELFSAHQMAARAVKRPLTLQLIKLLHRAIKEGSNLKDVGKFRTRQNWIGPEGGSIEEGYFFPPRYHLVPKYMDNLKHFINSKDKDPLVQIAIFFAQFLIIHPFMDGNGRVVRTLIPFLLCKKGLIRAPYFFMNHYFKRHRDKYFASLYAISKESDWERWIQFFLKGIIEEGERQMSSIS